MKDRYVNPFTDFGFKRLFGTEARKMKKEGESPAKISKYSGLS